ncbi:hypothetical protein VP1G_11502 [Cytospora mali]|uniref:Uncharacterized protein n=1 Tax=Cytospora mali TaxID=578113 RepID=A0A194VGJ6_CYTMA|nr:hypothetical protein VP1G_11502 [Valsa mali var. pyri (nom. inval.)]
MRFSKCHVTGGIVTWEEDHHPQGNSHTGGDTTQDTLRIRKGRSVTSWLDALGIVGMIRLDPPDEIDPYGTSLHEGF